MDSFMLVTCACVVVMCSPAQVAGRRSLQVVASVEVEFVAWSLLSTLIQRISMIWHDVSS